MDKKESWYDKYKRFIFLADDDCIRIDADVIPNERISQLEQFAALMVQGCTYDFYKNAIGITSPVFYSKVAIDIIRDNFNMIGRDRPETDASRIPQINSKLHNIQTVIGMHGFFQNKEDLERHKKNKKDRKQMELYDFELAEKLLNIK